MTETELSAVIGEYLERCGYQLRINSGGPVRRGKAVIQLAPAGTPDRVACVRGRFVAIEVKRPGETPSKVQQETHEHIRRAGGVVIVATSLEDVINGLKAVK